MNLELFNFIDVPYELQLETRNWRNAADVSKFFKLKLISEETHKKWLKSLTEKVEQVVSMVGPRYSKKLNVKTGTYNIR